MNTRGFTLVEIIVALGLFLIVMTMMMGGLVVVLDMNKKVSSMQVVMNNLNTTLETMTRDIRFGTYYTCHSSRFNKNSTKNCAGADLMAVRFQEESGDVFNIAYKFNTSNYTIERCKKSVAHDASTGETCTSNEWEPITSSEVHIDEFELFVQGVGGGGVHPRTTIIITGTVGTGQSETNFTIQTSVNQRVIDQ